MRTLYAPIWISCYLAGQIKHRKDTFLRYWTNSINCPYTIGGISENSEIYEKELTSSLVEKYDKTITLLY